MKYLRFATVFLLFVVIGALSWHSLGSINQDIGRHLKTGEIIWQTKSIPKINLFSFTQSDHSFVNHHWLSEVIFFLTYRSFGLRSLIILKVLIILASLGLVILSLKNKISLWPLLVSGFIGAFIFTDRTDVRPEIFSYLCLAFFIFSIFKVKYEKNYFWLSFTPLVEVFWVNAHIYFILGPLLIFLFAIDQLIYDKNYLKKIIIILLAVSAATLINPNFLKGVILPLTILNNYSYTIVENQSVFFIQDYGILLKQINLFLASLVILLFSFVIAIKNAQRRIVFELLTVSIFSILAFKMIRNFGVYSFIFIPTFALNLSTYNFPARIRTKKVKIILYLIFCTLLIWTTKNIINNKFFEFIDSNRQFGLIIPAGASGGVDFIKQNQIQGPMFNNFDVGSFLIWKLYPEQKVFIDGRPEAYSKEFVEKIYKPMQEDPKIWLKYSNLYQINYVFFDHHDITPWAKTFLNFISQDPNWPLVYLDNSVAIFLKKTPENAPVIAKYHLSSVP